MATTLYLTDAEQKLLAKLPESVRSGVVIEQETMTFEDSEEKMQIRLRNMTLTDHKLLALKEKAASVKSPADFQALSSGIDFGSLPEDDLIELYFAMGPNVLTALIAQTLPAVKTSDELTGVSALTAIRHNLLTSLSSASRA